DAVILEIQAMLRTERLVTIVGAGAIGKTTVAVSVGHGVLADLSGAAFFIDLSTASDKEQAFGAIASAIGLDPRSAGRGDVLLDTLRPRRALIILDNCEHLVDEIAEVTNGILQGAPEVRILVTSREALKVAGEDVLRLPPLDCPPERPGLTASEVLDYPAAQLFVDRISARNGNFSLDDDQAPMVAEICRKLDGIALAIEL